MFKKWLSLFLCACCFVMPVQAETSYFTEGREHSELSYEKLEARHVEEKEFVALLAEYDNKIKEDANFDSIMETFDALNDLQAEAMMASGLTYIQVVQDTSNTKASKEMAYLDSLVEQYANEINIRGRKLVQSKYRDQLKEEMEAVEFEFYDTYEEISETTLKLSEEESELLNEYYALSDDVKGNANKLADIYLRLMNVRQRLAQSEGYEDAVDYYYEEVFSRDYTADDLNDYRYEIKENVTSVFMQTVQQLMLLNDYPEGDFDEERNFLILKGFLNDINPEMLEGLNYLQEKGYYDLSVDGKKMDAGFTTMISDVNEAFIFNKGYGDYGDLMTLIHEFGHFNHYYFMSEEVMWESGNELDLAEIHSQGLEVLFSKQYGEIFGESQKFMSAYLVLNLTHSVLTGSLFDEFQVKAYRNKCSTEKELDELYLQLLEEYHLLSDEGENILGFDWREIHHSFEMPFYYISYANSAIPSLELYGILNQNEEKAIDMYMSLASDYDQNFVDVLKKHGFSDPFEKGSVTAMMNRIKGVEVEEVEDDEGNLFVNLFLPVLVVLVIISLIRARKKYA